MGNILTKFKRFIQNKNTVTILCVLLGILVLYVAYNWRVSSATKPTTIPYANKVLPSGHVITADDISVMEVSGTVLEKSKNILKLRGSIIGKKVAYGETIQANSFFFNDDLVDADSTTNSVFDNMGKGNAGVYLKVNIHSTFGNAIYPGNYIDLWFEGVDDNRQNIYAKFIRSIKVLDVTDSNGKSVFETGAESREPAELLFAVPDDLHELIYKAMTVGKLIPVPRNDTYSKNPGKTEIASQYLESFIRSRSAVTDTGTNEDLTE